MKGLRKYLAPFAPDISGASSVLYEMGGILVICDAGGCTGNVCGFDEPRWFSQRSCIFSAGLRDMDAIFGRDDRLVEKLKDACSQMEVSFACIIGTPVPAVIGTDYRALRRMAEKKTGLPVLTVETTGIRPYDVGEEMAYMELFRAFAKEQHEIRPGTVGVIGATPLDVSDLKIKEKLENVLLDESVTELYCYGMGDGLDRVREASAVEKNLVLSPAGLSAAKYLKERFGTPYEAGYPLAAKLLASAVELLASVVEDMEKEKVLIVHQQVLANELRKILRKHLTSGSSIDVASFFMMKKELREDGDRALHEEEELLELVRTGGYTVVIADSIFQPMFHPDVRFIDIPHFACSGRMCG